MKNQTFTLRQMYIERPRNSELTLIFAVFSVTFFLLLIFLRIPFPWLPLMSYQDAIDILTPLVLIPVYWLIFQSLTRGQASLADEIIFMIMAAFWAAGQGMHLSANSINNLIGNLANQQVVDVSGTDIYRLTYFYDEHLSHYLWHIGVIGLAALLIYESWRRPVEEVTSWGLVAPAAVLYGFNLFCIFVEGGTLPIGFPFVTAAGLIILIWGRKKLAQQPVLAFFFGSCALAFVLLVAWGLYWGGFPGILEGFSRLVGTAL
jgi:hypothetical protein